MLLWVVTLLIFYVGTGNGALVPATKLPTWITACYRDDPKFNECATMSGQKVILRLVKGDRAIRIPVLDPLQIVEIVLDQDVTKLGLDIVFRDITLLGLKDTIVKKFHMDFQAQKMEIDFLVPSLECPLTYNMSGQILVLPIRGNGPGKLTFKNLLLSLNFLYDLKRNSKDEKNYIKIKETAVEFNTTRAYFQFDNLFDGDKLLGPTMNQFLNDNWQEVVKNIGPALSEALGQVLAQIFNGIAEVVPYDDMVPLTPKNA